MSVDTFAIPDRAQLTPIPEWVKNKLSPAEIERYRVVWKYCSGYRNGHAVIPHEHIPALMRELGMNTHALRELAMLGVIRLVLNGNSTEIEIVE